MMISGGLVFLRFNGKGLLSDLTLKSPISQLVLHKESSLLAVALDDFNVNVVDCETRRVIRVFGPHGSRVTDMRFNNDCHWLITASMDSVIRVWDLSLGLLIDAFSTFSPCVSLSLSPTGEFLATCHSDDLGVYLWANISLYSAITLHPLPEDFEPVCISLPVIRSDEEEDEESKECEIIYENRDQEMYEIQEHSYKSPKQIAKNLITLSTLPDSKWKNLLNLDIIKRRNKPKEPVQKPQSAPFFLPTVAGLEPKFAIEGETKKSEDNVDSKIIDKLKPISKFGELLMSCNENCDYHPIFESLKAMGQSAIDAEIRSLSAQVDGTSDLLVYFLDAIETALQSNRDFDLLQSYLGLFLKIHVEDIVTNDELKNRCQRLSLKTDQIWDRLTDDFNKSLCLTNYLISAVL